MGATEGRIAGMFGRKREKKSPEAQPEASQPQQVVSSGGYVSTELPTFHGRTRKVTVYTSDANGKIIKTIKRK